MKMVENKIMLKIVDGGFAHCEYSNNPLPPTSFSKYIVWDRNVSEFEDAVFYTDNDILNPQLGHRKRIAWLSEPYCKQPFIYSWILENHHLYDYILTNEKVLLDIGEKFMFYPSRGCWIEVDFRKVEHKKTKLVSIITSGKNREGTAHYKRHEIIEKYGDMIDVMGRGYKTIEPIQVGLIDYMFHLALEPQSRDFYFGEKIINPIMVGTIPIYYGMDNIDKYFDIRGMILFKEVSEVGQILKEIDSKLYKSMLPYAKENFKIAQQYILQEDWMYENGVFEKMGVL
jgi:hypothetical protein